jgi:hypothetical protein
MYEPIREPARPRLLLIITPLVLLFTILMFELMWNDPPSIGRTVFLSGIAAVTFGLVAATLWPGSGRWGLRIVAFVVFFAYLAYMIDEFVFVRGPFLDPNDVHAPSPLLSLLGFLAIGLPSFQYAFTGAVLPRVRIRNSEPVRKADIIMERILKLGYWAHVVAILIAIGAAIVRFFSR